MIENKAPGKDISPTDLAEKFPRAAKKHDEHYSCFTIAGVEFGSERIPVFAGPNMVESRELILDVAQNVKKCGADFLRGGAFKPLTFPYRSAKYNETREVGLNWMAEAREKFGIPVISEIMEERFIPLFEECVDILQIGSRNMQNYPLLIACARTGMPIMLKRHFGCSLRDWLGAAEYILAEGNDKVILCERGVSVPHTHRESSRFLIDLQVLPAAREVTHLPICVDPSHATFWRPWVKSMTLASIAAGADCIMLEVHPDPENAAVDPLQAIDFQTFGDIMVDADRVAQAVNRRIGTL